MGRSTLLTLCLPPLRSRQEADVSLAGVRLRRSGERGTPQSPADPSCRTECVLTPRVPPPPLCLGPPVPIPRPWQAPTSCSRTRGASVGAPHGAASPPPRRARPAQSARPRCPQRSPAPRGARAVQQHGRGPAAGARARPMVLGVRRSVSPCLSPFLLSPKRREKPERVKKKMFQLLGAGCWRSLEAVQGRARARGGRWKLPPRRPGGGEEKEGFGGNEGDLKSRPAAALHLPSSPYRAALCCPLLPPAGRSRAHSVGRPHGDTRPLSRPQTRQQIQKARDYTRLQSWP